MKGSSARATGGQPRRRLFALALLLILSLSLGAALAFQAIQTSRRHRETAERALEDYAGFAAFILASQTYRQLGGAVVQSLGSWQPGVGPGAVPPGTTCEGGTTYFEQTSGSHTLHLIGASLPETVTGALTDTLHNAMNLLEEVGWRFRYIRIHTGPPDGFFLTSFKEPNGEYGVRGFSACLAGAESPFRAIMLSEHALPPAIAGSTPADSMFSVAVTAGGDRQLFHSPVSYASPFEGSARLGTEFGDLTLAVQLRADIANRLVIGGIPSSPTPLAAGLLGLSTLLVVTALLQLKREYELITIRSDFVSNVSHELRTPLSQILIFTELLKLGRLRTKAERDRSLDIIDQETRRLIRLVENVLQFSRSSAERRPMQCQDLGLPLVVNETLDAFRPLAAARGATLRSVVPAASSVKADRSALRQIMLNLLDNAVKYGPKGQTVNIEVLPINGRTRIVVDDQGPGIPLEDRERIWQGYYRLQRETNSAVAGSGIGLAVVRSLATGMGGTTWVEDAEAGGARFIVELETGNGEGL
ncbi:MAG: HAMP domain-containing sensor histidine kinase [Gemmatimonadota bacterium]